MDERTASEVYRLVAINAERYNAMAVSSEPSVQESLAGAARAAEASYRQLLDELRQHARDPQTSELLAHVHAADGRFAKAAVALCSAVESNFTATIEKERAQRFEPAARALLDAVDRLAAAQRGAIDAAAVGVHRQSVGAR